MPQNDLSRGTKVRKPLACYRGKESTTLPQAKGTHGVALGSKAGKEAGVTAQRPLKARP